GDPRAPPGGATLRVQPADRLQHAQLATAIGDRHGQRVDDAEDRDEHRHGNLDRGEAEPLIGDPDDVAFQLRVREYEQLTVAREPLENPLPDLGDVRTAHGVDAEDVHGVVVPVPDEERSIHQDRALLIRVIDAYAGDRQLGRGGL